MHFQSGALLLVAFGWARPCWALGMSPDENCFTSCHMSLETSQFSDIDSDASRFTRGCQSRLSLTSLYLCMQEFCSVESQIGQLDQFNQTCQKYSNTVLPSRIIIANYTRTNIEQLRRLSLEEAGYPQSQPLLLTEVVLPSDEFFRLCYDTVVWSFLVLETFLRTGANHSCQRIAYYQSDVHVQYGLVMYYFWMAVIATGVCSRVAVWFTKIDMRGWHQLTDNDASREADSEEKTSPFPNQLYTLMKKHISVPATFGYRCSQNTGWCTIPPRIHSLTIAAFVVVNVLLCSIDYSVFEGNQYWPTISKQLWRYISDRTGVISIANLPLVWLFGTRNNLLMWMTGWGFGTYNSFHRWIARVATLQAVVHSVGYTVMVMESGGWVDYKSYWGMHYFWNGELATIAMCAVCAFSLYGLRRSHYEIFLSLHIILSLIIGITMWYHVEIFDGEYNGFIWPCVFISVGDRVIRLARILAFNYKFWDTKALITYDQDSNIVRLVVPHGKSHINPQPGTYYYIYTFNDFRFWESHPFTLAYSTNGSDAELTLAQPSNPILDPTSTRILPSQNRYAESGPLCSAGEAETLLISSGSTPSQSMLFVIRPYDSFTSRLRASAISGQKSLRVLIEGPYGHSERLDEFESVLFVAGGTGIAVALSHLDRLLAAGSQTQLVQVIWAVREHAFLSTTLQTDLGGRGHLRNEKLSVTAYLTQGNLSENDSIREISNVRVEGGRPDVYSQLEEVARLARGGKLAVVACGPAQMADNTRRAVARLMGTRFGQIEYFEESFKW